jgi:hypothetical protein
MVLKTAVAAAIAATFWSLALADELRPVRYKITVLEEVRHEITVEAGDEWAARTVLYWKRAELRDRLIQRGNRRRQLYWRMYMKPATLR